MKIVRLLSVIGFQTASLEIISKDYPIIVIDKTVKATKRRTTSESLQMIQSCMLLSL